MLKTTMVGAVGVGVIWGDKEKKYGDNESEMNLRFSFVH